MSFFWERLLLSFSDM